MTNYRALCTALLEARNSGDDAALDTAWCAIEEVLRLPPTNDLCCLGMPKELLFPLLRAGLEHVSEVSGLGYHGLLRIKRIGPDRAKQIQDYLKCHA